MSFTGSQVMRVAKGIASLEQHRAYIDGLGTGFDPETFLTEMASFGGKVAGREYAALLRRYQV